MSTLDFVVVLDQSPTRGPAVASPFRELGCSVLRGSLLGGDEEYDPPLGDNPFPTDCLILVQHVRDKDTWSAQVKNLRAVCNIYYGGNDPATDPDLPRDCDRIFRPVMGAADAPTVWEAKELLDYARQLAAGKPVQVRPTILEPQRPLQFLPAIAILCQGFLFLHSVKGIREDEAHELLLRAQTKMGWPNLLKQPSFRHLLPPNLPEKLQQVARPSWWLRPFQESPFPDGRQRSSVVTDLRRSLKDEWDKAVRRLHGPNADPAIGESEWKRIDNLLRVLDDEANVDNPVVTPRLVADAYCPIADALGSMQEPDRCSHGNSGGASSTTTG